MKSAEILSSLKEHIESNPGINIRELPGLFKQLPDKVRPKHCTDAAAIRSFLERHVRVFLIDDNDCVFIRPPSPAEMEELPPADNLTTLCGAEGRISKVHSVYGFVSVDHPIKASVYFTVQHFENKSCKDLLSAGLHEGDRVVVDACKTFGHKAEFKATQVKRLAEVSEPAIKKGHLYNQCGVVDRVSPGYGFIAFGPGKRDSVFFPGRVVDRALAQRSLNLTDIFTIGDKVCFDAEPDKSGKNKAKWKATKVWCDQGAVGQHNPSDEDEGEEVFMSEDEEEGETEELLNQRTQQVGHYSVQSGREDSAKQGSVAQCNAAAPACDSEGPSAKASSAALMTDVPPSTRKAAGQKGRAAVGGDLDLPWSGAQASSSADGAEGADADEPSVSIYEGVTGTIVRALECIAAVRVKEGSVFREIDFTMDCFYKDGEVVLEDLNEVLKNGDEVTLDYMVGRAGRKDEVVHCDLLWQGAKPLGAPRLGPEEFLKRLVNVGRSRYAAAS